jgi:hypothetical protein
VGKGVLHIDISEEHVASIFRAEKKSHARNQYEAGSKQNHLLAKSLGLYSTTRQYIPETQLCITTAVRTSIPTERVLAYLLARALCSSPDWHNFLFL